MTSTVVCSQCDRPRYALGLCRACYSRDHYRKNRSLVAERAKLRRKTGEPARYSQARRDQSNPWTERICPLCGTEFKVRAQNRVKIYCSPKCRGRAIHIRNRYGLAADDYRRLTEGGKCFICQRKIKRWHVDHDHKSLETWGVICSRCNTQAVAGIGRDADAARRLVVYIENPPARALDGTPRYSTPTPPRAGRKVRPLTGNTEGESHGEV